MAKRIALLGATGSIGSSTLDLIRTHPDTLTLQSISGFSQITRLAEIANEFRVPRISVPNSQAQAELAAHLSYPADVLIGPQGLIELASDPEADLIMAAGLGAAGLPSTLAAAKAGKVNA